MKPIRVWARHYGPFSEVEWTVPEGVTAILGRNEGEGISSNGAGKTKLLELLPLALWGPSGSWGDYLTVGGESAACEVGLEFEHGSVSYRIRRTYSASGRGKTTLDFEREELSNRGDGESRTLELLWQPLTRENQRETQAEIERILGLTEATFGHSVFAKQSARHFADPDLSPRERKEILAEALGLAVYDLLLDLARADLRAADLQLTRLRGTTTAWEEAVSGRPAVEEAFRERKAAVSDLKERLAAARHSHGELQERYEAARQSRGKIDAANALLRAREQAHDGFRAKIEAAAEAKQLLDTLKPQIVEHDTYVAAAPKVQEQLNVLRAAEAEHAELLRENERLMADARRLDEEAAVEARKRPALRARMTTVEAQINAPPADDVCEHCGQKLVSDEARMQTYTRRQSEMTALAEEIARIDALVERKRADAAALEHDVNMKMTAGPDQAQIAKLEGVLSTIGDRKAQAATLRERLVRCQDAVAAVDSDHFRTFATEAAGLLQTARDELAELEATVIPEEEVRQLAADTLAADVDAQRLDMDLGNARTALGAAEQRLASLDEMAARLVETGGETAKLSARISVLGDLVRAYGRDGIPALIMEATAIPQIEREAQRILEAFGVPYRVELRTLRDQKTTDRQKDTLDVVVHEPNGERRYETYSGGERARVNVALRIALARLLAHRRGAGIQVFCLDEVEHLDSAGLSKLAELLHELQREIPVVLFISHDDALADAVDQTVLVVREDGRSRIEVAA